ncbi:MAG: 30S ribosomal protein S16 [Patescibacteria group bacterium]
MLAIKFSRRGKKKQPSYRLIVIDKKKDPYGNFIEDLGFYNPRTKKSQLKIERIKYWLSQGVQPTKSVYNLLVKEKIIEGPKIRIKIKKKKIEEKSPSQSEKEAVEKTA